MCEPANFAIQPRGISEIQVADCMCESASRFDAGVLKQRITDQMRWPVKSGAEAKIDIRLPEIDR
jgi:hypothetical protein